MTDSSELSSTTNCLQTLKIEVGAAGVEEGAVAGVEEVSEVMVEERDAQTGIAQSPEVLMSVLAKVQCRAQKPSL